MNQLIHQNLNVNTFETKSSGFKSELHMQGVIYENQKLIAFGYNDVPNILLNEFNLPNINGRIDLLIEKDEEIGVVELKNGPINNDAFTQIKNYLDNVVDNPNVFNQRLERNENRDKNSFFGLLVGLSLDEDTMFEILKHNNEQDNQYKLFVILLTRHITENDNVYIVSTPIISKNNANNGRDYSKYLFEGNVYGKGRLVLAVIKQHIENNPQISLTDLQQTFPSQIQGTFSIIQTLETLETSQSSRYFINDPISSSIGDFVICSQWSRNNINQFISKAQQLGFNIQTV